MKICPNRNLQEWKSLVNAVGEFEAYKDFIEYKGEIRTPEEVKQKMTSDYFYDSLPEEEKEYLRNRNRWTEEEMSSMTEPNTYESTNPILGGEPLNLDLEATNHHRAIEVAHHLADKLANQIGIPYEMVTAEQAHKITKNARNPYSGEPAFFLGDTVYFVNNRISTNLVLHEYSHPVVRAISKENKTLFNNLYEKVIASSEGVLIQMDVVNDYKDLDRDSNLFKEEVIVRALAKAASDKINSIQPSEGFLGAIKNILYSIKQLLRKVFGKIKIENLNIDTTLEQLGEMLTNSNFKINSEAINQSDVVAYAREQSEFIDNLKKLESPAIQHITNKFYDVAAKHLEDVSKRKDSAEMLEILKDRFGRNQLQEIKSNLSAYHSTLDQQITDLKDDVNRVNSHLGALTSSLFRLEFIANEMHNEMENISKDPNNKENLYKISYYNNFVKYWSKFLEDAKKDLNEANVNHNEPIFKLLTSIETPLKETTRISNTVFQKGVRDVLYETIKPVSDNIDAQYKELIDYLKKKGASAQTIAKHTADYEKVKITPEKFELLLKGEGGDANWFNSFLEGYTYNNDPVIASFALFVKNNMTEVMNKAQATYNDFVSDMGPVLEAAGYNPTNIAQLGKAVSFIDLEGTIDEDGNIQEKKVYTFLNPFKDYRFQLKKLKHEIDVAEVEALRTGDRSKMADLVAAYRDHLRNYFHQEYLPEYYEREEIFKTPMGKQAAYERSILLEKIRQLNETTPDEISEYEIADELDQLWREYRFMHSTLDLNGKRKTGEDLEKAMALKQYRDLSRDFYEWKERTGTFQNALLNFEQQLIDKGFKKDSEEYNSNRQSWITKNTRTVIKDEFYAKRAEIFDKIAAITANLPSTIKHKVDFSSAWQDILEAVAGFRDQDGQPIGSEMSEGRIDVVKKKQEEINKAREEFAGFSGLTTGEAQELSDLFSMIKSETRLEPADRERMNELISRKDELGLNKYQKAELNRLFAELADLQNKEATDYYIDIFNNHLSKLNTDKLVLNMGTRSINKLTSDFVLQDFIIDPLLDESPEFKEWFDKNHIRKKAFNKETMEHEYKWERLYIWNVVKPTDEQFLEKTELRDENGNITETIKGSPSLKYFTRAVKAEFRTKRILGQTWDGQNFLPKKTEQGAPDDRYTNHAYYDLQKSNPKMFIVLEKLKEHHLKNQEGLSKRSRLYLDIPRFRKEGLEVLQTKNIGKEKMSALSTWWKNVKAFFTEQPDDFEHGQNMKDKFNLVRADMFDNELTSVPIAGLYKLDLEEVSLDITHSMMRYMLSGERQKKLIEMSPVAQALKQVVNDPTNAVKNLDSVNKFNFINRGIKTYTNKKGKSVRGTAINALIAREFEGEHNASNVANSKGLNAAVQVMFKSASFGFFALNIPSALKNSFSAMVQNMIEAAGGRYLNVNSYHQGIAWSGKASMDISMEVNKKGPKNLNNQLIELFDPSSGRFEEKFGQSLSRTITKDVVSFSWLFSPRKFTELNATLGLFGGMMYHQKVTQVINNTTREIPYIEAWEIKDGKISLREGIDKSWDIGGEKYKFYRNRIQQINNNLNGAFSRFDQPEAQRYLLYRMISYMRRYLTTMAINRWGVNRLNVGLGETSEGFYITTLKAFAQGIRTMGKSLTYLSPKEKTAFLRSFAELGQIVAIQLLVSLVFGWDPGDKDRYEKLRKRSGALPGPFVIEDPEHPFEVDGWLSNHALSLLMNIQSENMMWIPVPGAGLKDYKQGLDFKSVAFGPTIEAYVNMLEDMANAAAGNEQAYYKRAIGPYEWQQEESFKLWSHLAHTAGLTGGSMDPVLAIKNFQSVRIRR